MSTGFLGLPFNWLGRLAVQSNNYVIRHLGAPAQAANITHHAGRVEKDKFIKKSASAPGTVSVWIRDPAGRLVKIGQG